MRRLWRGLVLTALVVLTGGFGLCAVLSGASAIEGLLSGGAGWAVLALAWAAIAGGLAWLCGREFRALRRRSNHDS